jgi:serine/threonine protein kinase
MRDSESHTASEPAGAQAPKSSTASQIRPRRPALFGRFELLARLRTGGMAELFRARELSPSSRIVALKRILPSFTDEADYVAMFIDEARLGMRLKHSGIVEAFELGQVEDELYIALEYVHGEDVGALLRRARERHEPLPVEVACRIALDVCAALDYAHELCDDNGAALGIVHRDVSPQNLLVAYDGEVKLIDFGIAKSSEQLMRTQAGLLKGKHGYLSPEQAQGQPVDRRSDLFSLGVCLYEMLSAERLFQGSSDFSTIVKVRKAEIPALRERNASVPEGLAAIVHRALAREPADRFESAAAMASALDDFVADRAERCDRARLAQFMRESFPDGLSGSATEPAAEDPRDPSTGLLDAFDDVRPPSALSALAALEQQAPIAQAAPAPRAALLEEVDAALLEEAHEDDRAGDELEDVGDLPREAGEPLRAGSPAVTLADDASHATAHDTLEMDPTRHGESTRIVEYESTDDGQIADQPTNVGRPSLRGDAIPEPVDEPRVEHLADMADVAEPNEDTRPRHRRPKGLELRAPLPGSAMDWDEEELSTHVYEPSDSTDVAAVSKQSVSASEPSVAVATGFGSMRPMGLASRPPSSSLRQRSAAPSPLASVRPAAVAMFRAADELTPSVRSASRVSRAPHPGLGRDSLTFAAAAVAVLVAAIVGALWLTRTPRTAGLRLTTDPLDSVVTLDGVSVGGSASPFVLTAVPSDVTHEIEVSKAGYKSWRTRLLLQPGQEVDLPHVQLAPDAPPRPVLVGLRPPTQPLMQPPTQQDEAALPAVHAAPISSPAPASSVTLAPPALRRPTRLTHPAPRSHPDYANAAQRGASSETGGGGTGTLRINSRPWSRVYVDGRLVGNTPRTDLVLNAGRHTVTLVNPDFNLKKILVVQLKRGELVTKIVALE